MFRKLLAGATAVVATAALSIVGLAAPATADSRSNPLEATHGVTVLTQGDATMSSSSETQGSWAVGGTLHVTQRYTLGSPVGGQSLPTLGGTSVQLVTGGAIGLTPSGEALDLNAGALRVGDTAGRVDGNDYAPRSDAFVRGSSAGVAIGSTLYHDEFGSAFDGLTASAATIHALDASGANVLTLDDPTNFNGLNGSEKGITLVAGRANLLRATAAQLSTISTLKLLGSVVPSASTPLYIDVTDAGAVTITLPKVAAGNGNSAQKTDVAPYTLFDFAAATSVAVQISDFADGAILAPSAAVTIATGTYEGQIVAKTFTHSGGNEIHGYVFGGTIPAPPTPPTADAAAAVSTTAATCTIGETLVLPTPTNATWGTPSGAPYVTTGPGDYQVTATAASDHAFADGSTTKTFSGTLAGPSTTGCGPTAVVLTVHPDYAPATCTAAGHLVLPTQTHVVWAGGADGAGPGTYTITAGVDDAGKYTLQGAPTGGWTIAVPDRGVNADGSPMNCASDCLKASSVKYTYDPTTNSGVITVTASKISDTLCNGFWVTAAAWKYTSTGYWPQVLDRYVDANSGNEITRAGTYPYGVQPNCGQGDIYASYGSKVATPSSTLDGPGNPYPEHFLFSMGFSGPHPTYVQQPTGTCNVLDRQVVAPKATAIAACGAYGSLSWTDQPGKVTYARTAGDGRTGHNEVTATAVSPWVFDDDTRTHVYSFELGSYADCVKPAVTSTVGACTANGSDPSTETVTFTFDNRASTRSVLFAIASEGISVAVDGGATATATAAAPEAGASYAVTADGSPLTTITIPSFTGCRTSIAGDPSAQPGTCQAGAQQPGSITVDLKPGVIYTITDAKGVATTVTQATTPESAGNYVVTADAAPNYVLTLQNPAKWPYQVTVLPAANCGVTPAVATAANTSSCSAGTYTLPLDPNVVWDVTTQYAGSPATTATGKAAGTYKVSTVVENVTITATANPASGVQFAPKAGGYTWMFPFTQPAAGCQLTTFADFTIDWSSTDAVCHAGIGAPTGTITVGPSDFFSEVAYFIDGTRVTSPTTAVTAGTHTLTAAIDPADTVDNPGPHTILIAAATAICATDLRTLALTGVDDPTIWIVAAVALLQLGLALVAIRLLRRRTGRHVARNLPRHGGLTGGA